MASQSHRICVPDSSSVCSDLTNAVLSLTVTKYFSCAYYVYIMLLFHILVIRHEHMLTFVWIYRPTCVLAANRAFVSCSVFWFSKLSSLTWNEVMCFIQFQPLMSSLHLPNGYSEITERFIRVISILASFSWGHGFKSPPWRRLSWQVVLIGLISKQVRG
jgi:hypothetical protein